MGGQERYGLTVNKIMYNSAMTKEEVISYIDSYLKPLGYHKKDKSWYKDNLETVTLFSLHQSRWGKIYYVTLGVNFIDLSEEKRPKIYKCHAQLRAEEFGELTEEYLSLEREMSEDDRKKKIKQLIDKSLPILKKMETITGFKELLEQFNPRLFMLGNQVQEYLGIKVE